MLVGNRALSRHGHAAMSMKGGSDEWIHIQTNTFNNWVNEQLREAGLHVNGFEDFCDGVILCALVETLQNRHIGKYTKNPTNHHQQLTNVTLALNAISSDNVKLVNIGPEDVTSGNAKLILGLIWQLILRYQIGKSKFPPKKLMIAWLQAVIPECDVSNFTKDWNNGIALHALIDYCKPGLSPHWRQLDTSKGLKNCRDGMEIAKKQFNIPLILRPEDITSAELDELSGMTYLSYYMKQNSPGYQATLNWVCDVSNQKVDNFTTDWNDGKVLGQLVTSLGGNVPALTGSNVENLEEGPAMTDHEPPSSPCATTSRMMSVTSPTLSHLHQSGKKKPRRSRSLGRPSSSAKEYMRNKRANESTQVKNVQCNNNRQCTAQSDEVRRECKRKRVASARASESADATALRLAGNRKRAASARASESADARAGRLKGNRQRASSAHASESADARELRHERNRKQTASARASESADATEVRLEGNRQRSASARASESTDTSHHRRKTNRENMSLSRTEQTDTARNCIRAENRNRMAALRVARLQEALQSGKKLGAIKDVKFFCETDFTPAPSHVLPPLIDATNECEHCHAYKWPEERPGFCCEKGKIVLEPLPPPPDELKYLYSNRLFMKKIRSYNNVLAMASIGCNQQVMPGFDPTFKIQGKVYHRIGSLRPEENDVPKFAQLYFHDTDHETDNRMRHNQDLDRNIVQNLQICIARENAYVRSLKAALDFTDNEHVSDVQIVLSAKKKPAEEHARRYNLPTASEVAVITSGEALDKMDVVLQTNTGEIQYIHSLHRSYDPLHYVLLFPFGTDGYTDDLPYAGEQRGHITPIQYYAFRLQIRPSPCDYLLRSKRLTQQFVCDMWAKAERHRLKWVYDHQKEIKADKYKCLLDAVNANEQQRAGIKYILPPSVYGSPRWYVEAYHDAMARVRENGKPDYFITFTCNPRWTEITQALYPNETPSDRPDLCARVFSIKKEALLKDLLKGQVLGKVKSYFCMKEDQKRGLPHVHILLIMEDEDKPEDAADVDRVVSAEIPDKETNPMLYDIITSNNIHGPCGTDNPNSPCMTTDGNTLRCTKSFPKKFCSSTYVTKETSPEYRRRSREDGGHVHKMYLHGYPYIVQNCWIVPYNPYLSLRYQSHINVEVVYTVNAVKYLYKYLTKGSDRVMLRFEVEHPNDEIKRYINARYISCSEGYWRVYGLQILDAYPPVEKLPLHLEDEQTVYFNDATVLNVANAPAPVTKLTAYFELNTTDADARQLRYPDIYKHYRWDKNKWIKRKRRQAKATGELLSIDSPFSDMIGRIPIINLNPHQSELYFLRMLLHNRCGATSFSDLRTIDGEEKPTYQEACRSLGLLDDDTEIDAAIEEVAAVRFGPHLREVFATILIFLKPSDPLAFWNRHRLILCLDLIRRAGEADLSNQTINCALLEIEEHLERHGLDIVKNFKLPKPTTPLHVIQESREIREETSFDTTTEAHVAAQRVANLNEDQRAVYTTVMDSIDNDKGIIVGLNAPGGTGKTYLVTTLLAQIRSRRMVALATAISGIAATLLPNGRTLHSRCKVPVNVSADSTCKISKRESTAELIRRCKLFVIDEVTMAHRHAYEAVDRTFRDIREDDRPFGGLTVILSGDWRQILPVVPRGSPADILDACLKSSPLWKNVTVMHLERNMRVEQASQNHEVTFANYLLQIGDGTVPVIPELSEYKIKIDDRFINTDITANTLEDLCHFVFEDLADNFHDAEWLCSRAILCPTNVAADDVNHLMMKFFPGEEKVYRSADRLTGQEQRRQQEHLYPVEFLNTIKLSGLPSHKLTLKVGMPIMLMRNLDPIRGHCNGTRYVIDSLHDHIIEATVAVGVHKGNKYFIPRIPLAPSDTRFPFSMERRQFPVRICFGMTSNRAQGQTLSKIGIYLKKDFFSHGQLYVALSRVGDPDKIRIVSNVGSFLDHEGTYTDNVVFKEVLL